MKILYDHQVFSVQEYGGISRYFVELMKHYQGSGNPEFEVAIDFSNNHYLLETGFNNVKAFLPKHNFRGKQWVIYYLNQLKYKNRLRKQDFDVFHPTYFHPYFLETIGKKPFVLDIHDMIHEIFPEANNPMDAGVKYKKILAQKADVIIAVSENTKKDILKFYDIPEEKIQVLYRGYSLAPVGKEYKPSFHVPEKFILFVGTRSQYKNFELFTRSIAPMLKEDKALYLVCAGGGNFTKHEIEFLNSLNIEGKVIQKGADDMLLAYLYQNALLFVFPSLYEGFGLPVLEAFSLGCPVASSDQSSLPEVGADAAVYFNPSSEESIYETISDLVKNEALRKEITSKGHERVKNFSWEKSAEGTRKIYEMVSKNKGA